MKENTMTVTTKQRMETFDQVIKLEPKRHEWNRAKELKKESDNYKRLPIMKKIPTL